MLDHDVERHPIAGDGNSDRLRDHRGDQLRIADRRQGDEIDSSGKALHELGRDLEAEPRLADAPGAGEREEACAFEKTPRLRNLPLAADEARTFSDEEQELVQLLGEVASSKGDGIQPAYQLARGFHRLLAQLREAIQDENAAALKRDEARYRNTTDGAWLDEREDYYKALTESQYVRQRARLVEILFIWWSDVLRANTGIARRELLKAKKQTETLAPRLKTPDILRRIHRLEELRDHLGRNIQEALAVEVAFLSVFTW